MRIAFGLGLLGAACVFACGSSSSHGVGSAGSSNSTAGSSNGGADSSGAGADNSNAGEAGDLGASGAPDTPVVVSMATPHAAGGLVAGGVIAHSASFTGVFSLGAAPGGNGVLTSATKQLRGGVIGASQK